MRFKKEEIRERILDAARAEFHSEGFKNASMRDIAGAAQVSVSNIYIYFKNKEELFYEVLAPFYARFSELVGGLTDNAAEEEFSAEYVASIIRTVGELVKRDRIELEIIMDKSGGTRYGSFKYELIRALEEHFREYSWRNKGSNGRETGRPFIYHLVATNLIEALLEISRHYVDNEWVDRTIEALITYHLFGITRLH